MGGDEAVFDQVNVVVSDMDAAVAFYELLGVEVPSTDPAWEPHHRTVAVGDGLDMDLDSAAFAATWNHGWPLGQTGVVIGFRVPSRDAVDRVHERLTGAGHRSLQAPYDAFWGARYAIVADPDGNAVGIMSPANADRRTTPPAPPAGA